MSDPARATVRDEDAFDVAAVAAWLREHGAPTCPDGTPEVRQFPGGASNLTYLLRYPSPRPDPAPPAGRREGQERPRHGPRARHPVGAGAGLPATCRGWSRFCDDPDVIGSDFYVMERLDGTILRRDLPDGHDAAPSRTPRTLCTNSLDVLVDLHAVDPAAAGLDRPRPGRGLRRAARSTAGRTGYRRARTDDVGDYERGDGAGSTSTSPTTSRPA